MYTQICEGLLELQHLVEQIFHDHYWWSIKEGMDIFAENKVWNI